MIELEVLLVLFMVKVLCVGIVLYCSGWNGDKIDIGL